MLTFLMWGMVAIVWVVTMVLAAWFAINFNPDTSNIPVWKSWCINALMIIVTLYTLPLLLIVIVIDLLYAGICKLGERF